MDVKDIQIQKALGTFKPNIYLSNLAITYFEEPTYAHRRVFPICPVDLPSGKYYEFSREDLAREREIFQLPSLPDCHRARQDYDSALPAHERSH